MAIDLNTLEGVLGTVKSADKADKVRPLQTHIDGIDFNVCGIGGLPRGRLTTFFAKPSAGKTTLALFIAAKVINDGGLVAWFEAEGAFTWEYAQLCGCQPLQKDEDGNIYGLELIDDFTTGEDAYYRVKQRLATDAYDLIILDSVDKLIPEVRIEAHASKASMYERQQLATLNAQFFPSLSGFEIKDKNGKYIKNKRKHLKVDEKTGKMTEVDTLHRLSDKKTALLFIQHAADDLNALSPNAVKTTGGDKAVFEASIRVYSKLVRTKTDSNGNLEYKKVYVKPVKNKVFSRIPGGCTLLLHPDGVVEEEDSTFFIDIAVQRGLFEQAGAWYTYVGGDVETLKEQFPEFIASDGSLKFQGKEAALELVEKADLRDKILLQE